MFALLTQPLLRAGWATLTSAERSRTTMENGK
jgi:hypothetical protein